MDHINQEHSGEQTIFACPFCTQPFNQYLEYLQHLGEHKDRVIRCRLCNKEFNTITRLRVHTKTHVNQCPLCSENFLTPQALQDQVTRTKVNFKTPSLPDSLSNPNQTSQNQSNIPVVQ